MSAQNFVWLSTGGGAWSLGYNWSDTTDGTNPSPTAPGAQDSVTVAGPSGASMETITGGGLAAAAVFTGNSLLSGRFAIGALTLGQAGGQSGGGPGSASGLLQLAAGSALAAGTASLVSGSLLVGAGATLSVSGSLSLGSGQASLNATGGGAVSILSLFMGAQADGIYVDPASIMEVGGTGQGRAGQLTIDAGGILAGCGNADGFGSLTNNGTLAAAGGTLTVGALAGSGALLIGTAATLALNGVCAAGEAVSFTGANATLALDAEAYTPAGILTGFAAGDAIDVRGSAISSASFQQTAASGGVLTLFYGAQVAATLHLAGNYAGSVFLTAGDGAGGTLVTVAPAVQGGGQPSPGTSTPDQYAWVGGSSGGWNVASGWSDVTSGQSPAAIAPGVHDLVGIAAAQGGFTVLAGPADAAALAITGEVALSGAFGIGTLTVGQAVGGPVLNGTLDLLAGTMINAATVLVADGGLSVSGSSTSLAVAGALTLGGGPSGVGLPIAALSVTAGAAVTAASCTLGGGSGASITTDPTGSLEIGTAQQTGGRAAPGAVSVDAGAILSGNGSVNPLGPVVDDGLILASGGTLSLGSVSGTGALAVAAGATLELLAATADPISLQGSAAAGASVLAFANARAAPRGTITGLVAGDVIHLEGSSLTAVQFAPSSTGGTLVLVYGTTAVARLSLTGTFTNARFILSPDGIGGSLVTMTTGTGGGGGPGQGGTDQLSWTAPVSGSWSRAANWTDVTIAGQASLPPGAQTPVQVTGPTGSNFEDITGTGTCASLAASGNTAFSGTFTTGQLTAAPGATLVIGTGTTLSALQAVLTGSVALSSGKGALLAVANTLAAGGGSTLLGAQAHGGIQCGGLSVAGASVNADAASWVEVGTAGGAALGALTVDAGMQVSGSGSLNLANAVIDNGVILAQAGTLWIGPVSGTGSLSIGTEATLAVTAADSCPIVFAGGGATLLLTGPTLPSGAILSLFAAGDAIVVGNTPVDSVSYQPSGTGIGTLTLSEAGRPVGQLLVAGSYAGQLFAVKPDGLGAEIIVAAQLFSGPPPGTIAPDSYTWTGGQSGAWSDVTRWTDVTLNQSPAAVAPGRNDIVAVAGDAGRVLTLAGPADAATLSLAGTVALAGLFSIGALEVGGGTAAVLSISGGSVVAAASAAVTGGIAVDGGTLAVETTLALGQAGGGGQGGALVAAGGAAAELGGVLLAGSFSALATNDTAFIEVGGSLGAAAGYITVDDGGLIQGAGSVGLNGRIVDQGTITASGGTLLLGSVSGTGTLMVGIGADLALQGTVSAGLMADFAGAGTLTLGVAALASAPAIADFNTGDQIILAAGGATGAAYVQTAPGAGVLTIAAGTQILAQLTLLGSQADRVFTVAGSAGGGTILTTAPGKIPGDGGGFVTNPTSSVGSQVTPGALEASLQGVLGYAVTDLSNVIGNTVTYEWFSTDGLPPGAASEFMPSVEIIGPLSDQTGGANGPGSAIAMQPGYSAVLLEGNESMGLTDNALGNALLVGNYGSDTLAALGSGDTLVGAPGANTIFFASLAAGARSAAVGHDVVVHGGGNDVIATNNQSALISTGNAGHSHVFLGSPQNYGSTNDVVVNGSDTVICGGGGSSARSVDNVTVRAAAGLAGQQVFGPQAGVLNFVGGNTPSTVVGCGGQIAMQGGAADGSVLWASDSPITYVGGAGSAIIVGGIGQTQVVGGTDAVTVFGGAGEGRYSGAPGSIFVVGDGPSTVQAGAGVGVYITGGANVSLAGGIGADVYAGTSTGNNIFQAGPGGETMWGGLGNDHFLASSGDDVFVSGGGNDIFGFTRGLTGGLDVIIGFVPGQSVIKLDGYGPTAPPITYGFGDSYLNLQDGTQIIVFGVSNLTASSIVTG